MRHSRITLSLLTVALATAAQACGTGTPEYKQQRDAFYACVRSHVEQESQPTTADSLAQKATTQWCDGEMHHWYDTLHADCPQAATDQQNAQGYTIFQTSTAKSLADMLQTARNHAQ